MPLILFYNLFHHFIFTYTFITYNMTAHLISFYTRTSNFIFILDV